MLVNNKVIWITGASSGIGEALAYELAGRNTRLILTARNKEKLRDVKSKCLDRGAVCEVIPADLYEIDAIPDLVEEAVALFGHIDLLINNAGISQRSLIGETPLSVDRKIMEINYFSGIALVKALLPSMVINGGGHIVAMSSVVGKFGFPLRSAYSASKHAMQGFFETLRAEFKADNIRVTIVSPGRIRTNISINAITGDGTNYGIMDRGQARGMASGKAAKKMVRAIETNKKELIMGGKEAVMVYIRKYIPPLYYYLSTRSSPTG